MKYIITVVICFLDQLSKFFIGKLIVRGDSVPIVKNIFHVTLVHNTGAAFGIFKSYPHLFIVIAFLAVGFILYHLRKAHTISILERTAFCFILGGIFGNLIDRIRFGYVVDFIDFRIWPVFNVADSFITMGAIMLLWLILERKR
ncbi:MAG: signal peptidase II [Candidatus Omnitrophota bacterium]